MSNMIPKCLTKLNCFICTSGKQYVNALIKVCQWYARVCHAQTTCGYTLGTVLVHFLSKMYPNCTIHNPLLVHFWYNFCQKCTQTVPCMVHFWCNSGTLLSKCANTVPCMVHFWQSCSTLVAQSVPKLCCVSIVVHISQHF